VQDPLCRSSEVPPGAIVSIARAAGEPVAVCNVDGTFYALEDRCSHGSSALSEGRLIGCEIECELHKGRFDVTTGKATRRPAKKPVITYACTVRDGQVYLGERLSAESLLESRAS
jgi:nitrite reductase/ring-hydroxylating ferredoxin subunit